MEDGHCKRALHAEANALGMAILNDVSVKGATLYYWDSKGRYAQSIDELREHCGGCAGLAATLGIDRVCGRGL